MNVEGSFPNISEEDAFSEEKWDFIEPIHIVSQSISPFWEERGMIVLVTLLFNHH